LSLESRTAHLMEQFRLLYETMTKTPEQRELESIERHRAADKYVRFVVLLFVLFSLFYCHYVIILFIGTSLFLPLLVYFLLVLSEMLFVNGVLEVVLHLIMLKMILKLQDSLETWVFFFFCFVFFCLFCCFVLVLFV
jgi:hypothetical protein